ncbi:MAG TPA: ATP-binding cassette domain-containing protein [Burkholderiales bacterium]
MAELLSVRGLRAGYKQIPILHGIDLAAHAGEILGILGHNGMGKTTLLKTLIGLLPASAGEVFFEGADIAALAPHARARRGLGYVPQGRDIFPGLSVRENIAMGAASVGRAVPEAVARAAADFPVLARLLERKGGTLSGGEQQILALARALAGEPKLLLLDEPTEGIQPSVVEEIEDHLRRLARERALTVLVVEQDLDFLANLADRVLVIQKGRIVRELEPRALHDVQTIDEVTGFIT